MRMELERGQRGNIKAMLTVANALQTLPEIRPLPFKWIKNSCLHAESEKKLLSGRHPLFCNNTLP